LSLLPISSPVPTSSLIDLAIYGDFDHRVPTTKIPVCYPALQLGWFPLSTCEVTFFSMIHATAPTLSTIRLCKFSDLETIATLSTMRTHTKFVGHQTWRADHLQMLQKNGRSDNRFVLLKAIPTATVQIREGAARKRWCWAYKLMGTYPG
jgi:hypothetical protein